MTCELAERNRQKIGESSRVRKIIQRKTEKGRVVVQTKKKMKKKEHGKMFT